MNSLFWSKPLAACVSPRTLLMAALLFAAAISTQAAANTPAISRGTESNAPSAILRFTNGDRLPGAPALIDLKQGVRWIRPDVAQPVDFRLGGVSEVEFLQAGIDPVKSTNTCRVRLRNQEILDGDLVDYDKNRLLLNTWYAGVLTIPRGELETLVPMTSSFTEIYTGPAGMEGWTSGKVANLATDSGEWAYRRGAFYATKPASIAQDLHLPDMASVRFDLAWKGTLHLAVALYTDYLHPVSLATKEKEPDFGGFYSLQINTYYANLLPVRQFEPLKYLGTAPVPALAQRNRCDVEIRVHKPKRTFALYVDGTMVKQWIDPEAFAGRGTAVRFVHQGQGQVRLANIRVLQWDGQLEEPLTQSTAASSTNTPAEAAVDRVTLRNGDRMDGLVENVSDGRAIVQSSTARLPIPLSRLRRIDFKPVPTTEAAETNATVKVDLTGGGWTRLKLERWTPEALLGDHAQLGRLKIQPQVVERISFTTTNSSLTAN